MCITDIILCKNMNDTVIGSQKKQTHFLARSNWRGKIFAYYCWYNPSQMQSKLTATKCFTSSSLVLTEFSVADHLSVNHLAVDGFK